MSEEYILYDLPSKGNNECWSPNTWKARAALNFKRVPYKTEFVPYTELKAVLGDKLGIPANPEGSFASYTLPAVQFPDGTCVMDSAEIAKKLEVTCPDPTLRLDEKLQQEVAATVRQVIFPMAPLVFRRVHDRIVTEDEMQWFRDDREKRAAKALERDSITLEEWENLRGVEALLNAGEPGMEQLSKLLKEHKQDSGPFILGSKVSFADFAVAGLVEFYRRCGDDCCKKLLESVAGLKELHAACDPWFQRRGN